MNWYSKREQYRTDYNILADALAEIIPFQRMLDIGSANGFLLDAFHEKGKQVRGIELNQEAVPYMSETAKEHTTIGDITVDREWGKFDLVTCIEVAEHIPEYKANLLVYAVAWNSKRYVYFTAATPFQGGNGHINCQPHFYWLNKFRQYGFHLNYELTEQLIEKIKHLKLCYWLPLNSLILTR